MKNTNKYIVPFLVMLGFLSCKDPYNPAVKNLDKEILVVEGFIDGANETVISIRRARSLGNVDTVFQEFVTDAFVMVEDDAGNIYPLSYSSQGDYKGSYTFNPDRKYRVRFSRMANQKEYASAFVTYKTSPPVDSISYRYEADGARFFVSTHDNTGNSKFYRWKYDETWEFHSFYYTGFRFDEVTSKVIPFTDSVYTCWQFDDSKDILIASTEKLSQDVVKEFSLQLIENGDYKLSYLYSINLTQYVMDSLGYNYFRQLKKNTEETGSIFDPQPGNLRGNVTSLSDPDEMVVGYIGAGSSYRVRKFFNIPWNFHEDCSDVVIVPNIKDSLNYYLRDGDYWPIEEQEDNMGKTYPSARNRCVDCTIRGTNVKPPYWP